MASFADSFFPWLALLLQVVVIIFSRPTLVESSFNCSSSGASCNAIVDYVLPNTTTLSSLSSLFFNTNNSYRSILGANNLLLSTPPNRTFPANHTLKIPFPCICSDGTGKSNALPVYTVVPGDFLYHIAAHVFANLVTVQDIQAANNIKDADLIEVGRQLRIPLPCSCDDVDGQRVVHYGHVVPAGSSVEAIAQQYNTSQDTLLKLNGLASPKQLQAGAVLDVPLPVCKSEISNKSRDYPLLVPSGTYVITAADCVMCRCDVANNLTLQCEPTQIKSSLWLSCPSMQCEGAGNLSLGNSTPSSCGFKNCAYAGYINQTILTATVNSTCPTSDDNAAAISSHSSVWNLLLISIHLFLCFHLSW